MPTLSFIKDFPPLEVAAGSNLMQSLLQAEMPVASSCHGEGVCGKCHIRVVEKPEGLSEISDLEQGILERNNLGKDRRISCQTQIIGDTTIDATYW